MSVMQWHITVRRAGAGGSSGGGVITPYKVTEVRPGSLLPS